MLHLFYVYSGIVARMVPLIIDHLHLPAEDIVIVTDRSQGTNSAPAGLRVFQADFKPFRNRWKSLPDDWKALSDNSRRIDDITEKRPFIAYLPSPSDNPCQQILWHPKCRNYWLIEEGLGSYCQPGVSPVHEKPFTRYQKLQLGLRLRARGRIRPTLTDYPHWPTKYAGAFGSNAATFPDFPPPVINLNLPLYQAVDCPHTRLVIFDDFSIFQPDLQKIYLDVVRRVVFREHRETDHWAYKLHPRCAAWPDLLAEAQHVFNEALPEGTPCETLPPDSSAEDIGLSPQVTTYGYMSSCLFYIHQCGGRVVSFKNLLDASDPAFPAFWRRFFPPVLEQLVEHYRILDIDDNPIIE